ncbi:Ribosome_subunit biogenesis protein NIP7 [Hexamita inflata]|uniref:60S ribosome subunit biogenesis protein NIP7 homolog n=1 Tax=Hexamita inflata TaxID=28002 RepID=A0AA86RBD7_9EUKA|nr:Ribosome subunit biogenesis protein NIP7 [Hexamita inflata]CAI9967875.1 Ribosome subunit biogenesis protein NIP7 [Hexamita inflata]CAI9968125.1 Ribosome subunit biogenesis protein NIP7 [Hexamita inflata]CAI9974896.1 Ribosome subunit biogenesis protein NIP7 [Hexamita inflata]
MRELKEEEAQLLFEKLAKYVGDNSERLLTRTDGNYVFRLIKNRIYYMSEQLAKQCPTSDARKLHGAGILVGKLTHNGHFHINITCLPLLEQFASHKIWLTKSAELQFLYGNDLIRSHVQKMSDGIPDNAGVVVFNEQDGAVGFGVMTKAGVDAARSQFGARVVIHQADVGEYLRDQEQMF